jgi:hypothetical protein
MQATAKLTINVPIGLNLDMKSMKSFIAELSEHKLERFPNRPRHGQNAATGIKRQAFDAVIRLKSATGTTALHQPGEAGAPNRARSAAAPSKIQRLKTV